MVILGWLLIVVGFLFLLLAFAGAAAELVRTYLTAPRERGITVGAAIKLIKAITDLLKTLFSGPRWFLAFVVGLVLIYLGVRLVTRLPLLPF